MLKLLSTATGIHILSMAFLAVLPSETNKIWDLGHYFVPATQSLMGFVECATLMIPVAIWSLTPARERIPTAKRAMRMFAILLVLRALCIAMTVLPLLWTVPPGSPRLLIGHGIRDYIFSGHTALVASWLLAPYRISYFTCIVGIVHALGLLASRMHYTIDIVLAWVFAWFVFHSPPQVSLSMVQEDADTRREIYKARHDIYAVELGQYTCTSTKELHDYTDGYNTYIVAKRGEALQGFIAITHPGHVKALVKHGIHPVDTSSYEIRLLSVLKGCRRQGIARALIHAALRYIEASGGTSFEAMARLEVLRAYIDRGASVVDRTGLRTVGNVQYVHIHATLEDWNASPPDDIHFLWNLPFPRDTSPMACTHGGKGLESLAVLGINADVLDAWFPPAPAIIDALAANVETDAKTTPPSGCRELLDALATNRGLDPKYFVFGAGSSDLIYRCFFAWLTPSSRVLLLDPTYAEYKHILSTIGCEVVSLSVDNTHKLTVSCIPDSRNFDLVVLVNPNSSTSIFSETLEEITQLFHENTRIWIDETYIEYVGKERSLERMVPKSPNIIICKSMSKAYALSGLRVGYICAHPIQLDEIKRRTPPWIVSRLAQRAAVVALQNEEYYLTQYIKTHKLRSELVDCLERLGWKVVREACANFIICHPPRPHTARAIQQMCAREKVFIRLIDDNTIRIAVKDSASLKIMVQTIDHASQNY